MRFSPQKPNTTDTPICSPPIPGVGGGRAREIITATGRQRFPREGGSVPRPVRLRPEVLQREVDAGGMEVGGGQIMRIPSFRVISHNLAYFRVIT